MRLHQRTHPAFSSFPNNLLSLKGCTLRTDSTAAPGYEESAEIHWRIIQNDPFFCLSAVSIALVPESSSAPYVDGKQFSAAPFLESPA